MSELDLDLKLKFERVLWAAGYYTRCDVKLAAFAGSNARGSRSASELTDVDVLGMRFFEDLLLRKVASDCKSGQRVSVIGRVFWLRGVMDHLQAERGYALMSRELPEAQRESAAKLSITVLNEKRLTEMAARYPGMPVNLRIGSREAHTYIENNLSTLTKQLTSLVDFRNTEYWYYSAPRAISQAIAITRRCTPDLNLQDKWHRALLLDVATLFSISVLTMAGDVLRLMPSDLLEGVRVLFFDGIEGVERRQTMIRRMQSILDRLSLQTPLPLTGAEVFQLDPPYLPVLADVLVRVIAHPLEAAEAPRYLKLRLLHGILYGEWDLPALMGASYSPLADKLASDLALAFMNSCGFDLKQSESLGIR